MADYTSQIRNFILNTSLQIEDLISKPFRRPRAHNRRKMRRRRAGISLLARKNQPCAFCRQTAPAAYPLHAGREVMNK